ncbi:MAG TPA: hypothetical protein VNG51_19410 [Ktedonobacteraceae bacterium]|nr:hypothetical protein [Ktedonobacteraceae bacterium]
MDQQLTQPSQSQPPAPTVKSLSGYDEGTVLSDSEVVKGSYDENGKLVGWHKEVPGRDGNH